MRPKLLAPDGSPIAEGVTVVLVEADPDDTTRQFRHMVKQTHDPQQRYEAAVKFLSAAYFQHPEAFDDRPMALFVGKSTVARVALDLGRVILVFQQFGQSYRLPSAAVELGDDDPAWQATYWHNALFNPAIPPHPHVLAFEPDWAQATAFPPLEAPRAATRGMPTGR
ncbi:MAG: hypothetical protein EXQ94_06380 [Alphaproteobacteria bacterium]|nr:hypothetical protein [Alphaproteobacteria bacterium]